ncbi:unnamed protein product [Phytophthora lilii]|uniref:Unnamed protein product n=1 Tax=Phytophthora lilii TaxID=2077276 RepID=A0A9W6YJ36_9STRA|nr:unnamed protein product [Phytophthora lilii]
MGRRAEVRGATVAIPLDGEAGCGCGSIVGTTQDGVVLRAGGNSLRVLDAQAFCAGHIRVRHVVELPQNVNIATKHSLVRFGAAWDEHAVYCLDFQTGGVAATPLPMLDEPIADAFVSENGGQIVVVGSTSGKLYGWSQCDRDYNEKLETWNEPGWRIVDGTTIGSQQVDTCSCGQFANSALLGNSFIYLRATRNSGGCTILEKWIFDVDSRWSIVHFSSKVLSDSCSDSGLAKGLTLFIAGKWEVAVLTIGSFLCCMQVDQDLSWSSVRHASLDQPIIQGTWINGSGAFAMLLSNGTVLLIF